MALSNDDDNMPDASGGKIIDDNVTEEEGEEEEEEEEEDDDDDDFEEEGNQSDAEEHVDRLDEDFVDDLSEAFDERPRKKKAVPAAVSRKGAFMTLGRTKPVPTSSETPQLPVKTRTNAPPKPSISEDPDCEEPNLPRGKNPIFRDIYKYQNGVGADSPPVSNLDEIYRSMVEKLLPLGLKNVLALLSNRPLNIATMCSGTEAPILFFREVNQSLEALGETNLLRFIHQFSAEIEPFKQHYIQANAGDVPIFRDIIEFSKHAEGPLMATTVYGSKIEVPSNIDLLVAGFCCVDFSSLNKKKKTLDDGGESGDTLQAVIDYASVHRPKMILLENVELAPWVDKPPPKETDSPEVKKKWAENNKPSITSRFEDIGYSSICISVDTKHYYVPETRKRIYMLLVAKILFEEHRWEELAAMLQEWKKLVMGQKSPATAPVEQFLLKVDDPLLRSALTDKVSRKSSKIIEWQKCQIGHQLYRNDLQLGDKRPITSWTRDACPRNPDFHFPLVERTNRISDFIDIAHLRTVQRGADDRYYSRNYDLSQNVFREQDKRKSGIIGCYTPHGIPYSTTRGGKIIGREGLLLQGLPVEKMDLSQLSDAQQDDLAGNAMSATVLGPAMLSAIIVFYDILKPDDNRAAMIEKLIVPALGGEDILVCKSIDPAAFVEKPVSEILFMAARSTRFCYCEGRDDRVNIGIRQCCDCKHTICGRCAQNQSHNFRPIDDSVLECRIDPHEFEAYIKAALPMKISFGTSFNLDQCFERFRDACKGPLKSEIGVALDVLRKALASDVGYRETRRREVWDIEYYSKFSRLRLTISSSKCEWLLYAQVPEDMKGNDPVRTFFEKFPIAQMKPSHELITEGPWKFWVPEARQFEATITSSGPVVPSYGALIGLKKAAGEYVHTKCKVEVKNSNNMASICGEYVLYQTCGQAFNSLHKKAKGPMTSQDLFFYFDHEGQKGNPADHGFVFTEETRRLDYGEMRPCHARTAYRQPIVEKDSVENKVEVTINVDGEWISLNGFQIAPSQLRNLEYHHISRSPTLDLHCQSPLAAFVCRLSIENINLSLPKDKWIEVGPGNEVQVFDQVRWTLEKAKVIDGHVSENLPRFGTWHTIVCDEVNCQTCAPKAPNLKWAYEKKPAKGKKKLQQIAFEDPKMASDFESAWKRRPPGIPIFVRISQRYLDLKVGINPKTLCHRAVAALQPRGPVHTSWCFVTDDAPMKVRCLPYDLKDTVDEKIGRQPPGFSRHFALRPEQLRTLSWMLNQERGISFSEREFVEAKHRQMGYLVMAQASEQRTSRGGIIASEVGFGKTVVILALVLSCLEADKDFVKNYTGDLIPTKATLVFVPAQLPKQWKSEAEKFLGKPLPGTILVIERIPDLAKYTVKDIQNAILVIVSCSVCQKEDYILALATLSGMVEPAETASSRAKATWHKTARAALKSAMEALKNDPAEFQDYLDEKFETNKEVARAEDLPVPSKRYTGAQYQKQNKKRNLAVMNGETAAGQEALKPRDKIGFKDPRHPKLSGLKGIILEMFKWARVVYDEFTYYNAIENPTMISIVANSRWALSGTAPNDNFAGVKMMAQFLDIYLGQDDWSHMPKDAKEKAMKDFTPSEKLLTYQGVASGRLLQLRDNQARNFCELFVRRDLTTIPPITCFEHLHLITQPIAAAGAYLELEHRVLAKDFDVKANHVSKSDKENKITEVLAESENPRAALLLRASYFSVLHDETSQRELESRPNQTAMEIFNTILGVRERQCLEAKSQLVKRFDIAVWLHHQLENTTTVTFDQRLKQIQTNHYGDKEVTRELCSIIDNGFKEYDYDNKPYLENDGCFKDGSFKDGLQTATSQVTRLVLEFLHRTQSHRFYKSYQSIQTRQASCDLCQKAHDKVRLEDFALLSSCGHLFCGPCSQRCISDCPFDGCKGASDEIGMVLAAHTFADKAVESYPFGEKLRRIVELILHHIPEKDQVIMFVQSEFLRRKVTEALVYSGISFTDLKPNSNGSCVSAAQLERFQAATKGQVDKVIILKMGDASAAGSNLTMANHLMFVSPYLTFGSTAQEDYAKARTQAKGRAIRFGQGKDVHIHDFITTYTVDVDVYEHREVKVIKDIEGKPTLLPATFGEHGEYSSRLREKFFNVEGEEI